MNLTYVQKEINMKIAIPVEEQNIQTTVCVSFGRAPFFMVYDLETNQAEFLENPAASSPGGAGVKAAQFVVDQQVDCLLTPRCGENAAEVIQGAKIKIYKTVEPSVEKTLNQFKADALSILNEVHAGFHNH